MNKLLALAIICGYLFVGTTAFAAPTSSTNVTSSTNLTPDSSSNPTVPQRLFGATRYETAQAISECYNPGKVKSLILATGNEFADSLAASVLAHDKEAPILLVDSTVTGSQAAFTYLSQHLTPDGIIYIVGGTGVISPEFDGKLTDLGYKNIVRIAGEDRYDTSCQIAGALSVKAPSTVVISSGEEYPDAISISSFAAKEEWPILLSPHDALPQEIQDYLLNIKPPNVFITGGTAALTENVESQLHTLLPEATIDRLTGPSRFDTNIKIVQTFAHNPPTLYLTTGYNFADAMAGSVLAAEKGDPIIFVNPASPTLPKADADYFSKLFADNMRPSLVCFGGSGAVSDEILKNCRDLINGTVKETDIYSVSDISAEVHQSQSYNLPATVPAKLYNSDAVNVPVTWSPAKADTSKIGSKIYQGVVSGYAKNIKLTLKVTDPLPIGEYTTYFDASQVNRSDNLRLAAKALDGKQLASGETFSFNQSVGERTAEAGYKEALIIEGDSFTPGLGGGVCQASSTLYNAVLAAGLEIVERHPHSLAISYVPPGRDATVAYPYLDFKFKNNTDGNILIRSSVTGNSLTFKIYKH